MRIRVHKDIEREGSISEFLHQHVVLEHTPRPQTEVGRRASFVGPDKFDVERLHDIGRDFGSCLSDSNASEWNSRRMLFPDMRLSLSLSLSVLHSTTRPDLTD
jgi:hypothetical protein